VAQPLVQPLVLTTLGAQLGHQRAGARIVTQGLEQAVALEERVAREPVARGVAPPRDTRTRLPWARASGEVVLNRPAVLERRNPAL
jgi:hypothetical protein